MKKHILIIDDDKECIDALSADLKTEDYEVHTLKNINNIGDLLTLRPDLIILGIILPDVSGIDVLKELKRNTVSSSIPVIILTKKDSEADEILGLELGADDYIVKPIQIQKLLARIRTIFRRQKAARDSAHGNEEVVIFEEIEIHIPNYMVKYHNNIIVFPKKEFETLVLLLRNRGRVITRDNIFKSVWNSNSKALSRTIDVHIGRIRKKLGQCGKLIETVPGVGYRFRS